MTDDTIKAIIEWGKKVVALLRESGANAAAQAETPKKAFAWYAAGLAILAAAALLGFWLWTAAAGAGGDNVNARIGDLQRDTDAAAKTAREVVSEGKRREGAAIHAAITTTRRADADKLPELLASLLRDWRAEQAGGAPR